MDSAATVVVDGTEDPVFQTLIGGLALNDIGQPLFATSGGGSDANAGVFTGNDAVADRVIRVGELPFGNPVNELRLGAHSLSSRGDAVFLMSEWTTDIYGIRSRIVRATPKQVAQVIAFGPLPDRTVGDPPFAVTASATSGLPVTFGAGGAAR